MRDPGNEVGSYYKLVYHIITCFRDLKKFT